MPRPTSFHFLTFHWSHSDHSARFSYFPSLNRLDLRPPLSTRFNLKLQTEPLKTENSKVNFLIKYIIFFLFYFLGLSTSKTACKRRLGYLTRQKGLSQKRRATVYGSVRVRGLSRPVIILTRKSSMKLWNFAIMDVNKRATRSVARHRK